MPEEADAYTKKLEKMDNSMDEINRLKYQAKVTFEKEYDIFKLLGVQDGMSILEVGSGPGYISELLIEAFPNSELTCVEVNDDLVSIAKKNLNEKNIEIINESILECSLPENSFDIVYARLVFMHIPNTQKALEVIFRLLKLGGILIVSEAEDQFNIIEPDTDPPYQKLMAISQQIQMQDGGDRTISRKLPRFMTKTGFIDIKLNCVLVHSQIESPEILKQAFTISQIQGLVDMKFITEKEFKSLEEYHKSFPKDENNFAIFGMIIISCKKPDND